MAVYDIADACIIVYRHLPGAGTGSTDVDEGQETVRRPTLHGRSQFHLGGAVGAHVLGGQCQDGLRS